MAQNTTRLYISILFVLSLAVFLFPLVYNLAHAPFFAPLLGSDTIPTALIPASLIGSGEFDLSQFKSYFDTLAKTWGTDVPYIVVPVNGRLVSNYPILAGVLALPFTGLWFGLGHTSIPTDAFYAARIAAAIITTCAGIAFYCACRCLTNPRTSFLVTLVFLFGTSVWSTASQALWQHTPSLLFQSLALVFLLRGRVAPAGVFLSLAIAARPANLTTGAILAAYVFIMHRREFVRFATYAVISAVPLLVYNTLFNGHPLIFGFEGINANQWAMPSVSSLAGLLFSPSRGLFIFSPLLVLALIGGWLAIRECRHPLYAYVMVAVVVFTVMLSAWNDWWGGWGYGPRLLTDALPLIALLLVPVFERLRGRQIAVVGVLFAYSASLQMLGLWDYGGQWHHTYDSQVPAILWSVGDSAPLYYFKSFTNDILRRVFL